MLILILGYNANSVYLANTFVNLGHDVVVITEETQTTQTLEALDLKLIHGRPSHPDVLRLAHAHEADMLLAITNNDEMNMVACQVAYSLFQVPKKIAKISSSHYLIRHELFGDQNLPIDTFVNLEQLVADYIGRMIRFTGAIEALDIAQHSQCLTCSIASNSPLCGIAKQNLWADDDTPQLLDITRAYQSLKDNDLIQEDDLITFVATNQNAQTWLKQCQPLSTRIQHIMLGGGGQIGLTLAHHLQHDHRVKLIESNPERAKQLANLLPNTPVLHGDITHTHLLKQEGIDHCHLFCSLSGDDEDNILSAMQAKHLGCQQTLALIRHPQYQSLLQHTSLDSVLAPPPLLRNAMLPLCTSPAIHSIHHLHHQPGVLIEVRVDGPWSHWAHHPLHQPLMSAPYQLVAVSQHGHLHTQAPWPTLLPQDRLWLYFKQAEHAATLLYT